MADRPIILLTNDDGVEAPGLAALAKGTEHLAGRRIQAPSGPRSGCGHQVTTHSVIHQHDHESNAAAVDGTPADCVRVAIHQIHVAGSRIAWVLSGINAGGNLGTDLHHSGTAAAAREAALHGIPGIALSHYIVRGRALDWDRAARWAKRVIDILMAGPPRPGTFWNVNFPHPEHGSPDPEIVFCPVDPSPLPLGFRDVDGGGLHYSADYSARARIPFGDVSTCFGGAIAVSLVPVVASIWPIDSD